MITAGVAQLKARFSEYLTRVRAGEEIVVTDHGRPVAMLVPTSGGDEHLVELQRQGLVRVRSMKLPEGFLDVALPESQDSVVDALIDERRSGR